MNVLYSFNKQGFEADYWAREIAAASKEKLCFTPFNHDPYLAPRQYMGAQLLDNPYYDLGPELLSLFSDFEGALTDSHADAVIVDNCAPYHPDYLRRLPIYKVLRTSDGPTAAYERDLAYLHLYDHVLYHSPAYSSDTGMAKNLRFCGAKNIDFWSMALLDTAFDAPNRKKRYSPAKQISTSSSLAASTLARCQSWQQS